jgi:hypothetical protein
VPPSAAGKYSLLYPGPGGPLDRRERGPGRSVIGVETTHVPGGTVNLLLWPLLVLSVLGNAVASFTPADTTVHLAFGTVTALAATALAVRRLRTGL